MMTNSHRFSYIIFFCLLLFSFIGFGQKLEIEKRIRQDDFPVKAIQYLEENYGLEGKIKWYTEESGEQKSYEAKFSREQQLYSVEFYEDGSLMDVEIEISYEDIPAESRSLIEKKWDHDFRKSRVRRVQQQESELGRRYEIIVRGKKDKNTELYEYLFESDGQFVKSLMILARPDDLNLY
ncbi:MAG TPA: hypothetical protein VJ917_00260 [Saprospiraceae bacterium]|nr:hypothetical protein [Saprospiraceae bacterium]